MTVQELTLTASVPKHIAHQLEKANQCLGRCYRAAVSKKTLNRACRHYRQADRLFHKWSKRVAILPLSAFTLSPKEFTEPE